MDQRLANYQPPHRHMHQTLYAKPIQGTSQRRLIISSLAWLFCGWAWCIANGLATAQSNVSSDAKQLDQTQMAAELKRLDAICQRLALTSEQRVLQDWIVPDATDTQILFLPVAIDPLVKNQPTPTNASSPHGQWLKHFTTARQSHARYWLSQAQQLAARDDEWEAYQCLWKAIREDPDNAEVKRVLGPLLVGLNVRNRPRSSPTPHPQFGWPQGSFTRLDTANFQIISRADSQQTLAVAAQLETAFALWTQVFYPLWAPPRVLQARLAGRNPAWQPRREFRVVLCKDRQEYLQTLGVSEANIDVSVGYYNPETRLSFFYPDAQLESTLFHELTHQLLAEGSQLGGGLQAGRKSNFWMVEGIALYMETLVDRGNHWELGGWLTPRMQAARYRALHDGTWMPWDTFSAGGMDDWKTSEDINVRYTQAAGLVHFFLDRRLPAQASEQLSSAPIGVPTNTPTGSADDLSAAQAQDTDQAHARRAALNIASYDSHASRTAFYQALVAVYQDAPPNDQLLKLLGQTEAQRNYLHFLLARDRHLLSPATADGITDLVLTHSQLSPTAWQQVARFEKLQWLDLSFSNVTDADATWLSRLTNLERLSLEHTAITNDLLSAIAQLPGLQQLDLTHCAIDDQGLKQLSSLLALQQLGLSGTRITSASIATLDSLPKLEQVAVDQTAISPQQAAELLARLAKRQAR